MSKQLRKHFQKLEILQNRNNFFILIAALIILSGGLFFRIFRTGQILGFYFDQGRDAMAVWNLLHYSDFFLIGPTTGIAGIFRGPFYFYLITPFYWLSGGDPVLPANFLSFTTIVAGGVLFYLAKKAANTAAGIIALFISSFSYSLIFSSRWLSNPTPMFLLSTLLIFSMYKILEGKKWYWVLLSFLAGLSLFHFGSSGEFFYFPAIFIFALWQLTPSKRKANFPKIKQIIYSALAFLFTILPLIVFDFRNDQILSNNIRTFLFEKESFKSNFWQVVEERINFYFHTFSEILFPSLSFTTRLMLIVVALAFILYIPKLIKSDYVKAVIILFFAPIIGLLFFQGNEGNIYGYYLTGYYLVFVLIVSFVLGMLWNSLPGKVLVLIFLCVFAFNNIPSAWSRINDGGHGPETIIFTNQKQAIEWIYKDAGGDEFNVDVYVPPVIPHAYDYLFTWYKTTFTTPELLVSQDKQVEERVELLYTLYEVDPPHPERLEAWLLRQSSIGEVEYEASFGGITVQRRHRI